MKPPCGLAFGPLSLLLISLLLVSCGVSRTRLTPQPSSPGDWTTTRGALDNRGLASDPGTLRIDTLLWQCRTGGIASTEPIIQGGLLYFSGRDRRLEIIDAETGKRLVRERFQGPVTGALPSDTMFAFATDQNERKVFIYSYSPVREIAKFDIPISSAPPRRLADGSILIAGIHGELVRFGSGGDVIWSVNAAAPISSSPAITDSLILIAAGRTVSARRIADGSVVWSHLASGAVRAAPAVGDDIVYFGSTDSLLYAVTLGAGSMQWFFAGSGQILTSPTVGDERVYLASNDQKVYALDRKTGRQVWSYDTGAPANTEPTLAGDLLYVSTQLGKLLVLDAATGALNREFDLSAPAATAPIVANGRVYVADTRRQLYCFGPYDQPQALTETR